MGKDTLRSDLARSQSVKITSADAARIEATLAGDRAALQAHDGECLMGTEPAHFLRDTISRHGA